MIRHLRFCGLCLLALSFSLPGRAGLVVHPARKGPVTNIGNLWSQAPVSGNVPAFRYQVEEVSNGFRFHVVPSESCSLDDWSIQLWVADRAMVQRRVNVIGQIRKIIHEMEIEQGRPEEQVCLANIQAFLEQAREALQRCRNYDPFYQAQWCFSSEGNPIEETTHSRALTMQHDANGMTYYTGTFQLDRNLDAAALQVRELAWGLSLVPRSEHSPKPIRVPWQLTLKKPWKLLPQMDPDHILLLKMIGKPVRRHQKLTRFRHEN